MSPALSPTPQPSYVAKGPRSSRLVGLTACLLALAAPLAFGDLASAQITSPGSTATGPSGSTSGAPARATGLALETLFGPGPRARRRLIEGNAFGHGGYAPWNAFVLDAGGHWDVLWDADTGVPLRIYGSGIAAPGASVDPITAERAARALLDRHLALLAPGSSPADFVLAENVVTPYGLRVVSFLQHRDGVPVEGGAVAFDFRADRVSLIASTAVPYVQRYLQGRGPSVAGPIARAELEAEAYVGQIFGGAPQTEASELMILPVIHGRGRLSAHLVHRVRVRVPRPLGLWEVYLDAETAAPIARRSLLTSFEGQILYDVPVRHPGGDRMDYPVSLATGSVDGSPQSTDAMGRFTWSGGSSTAAITVSPIGSDVRVLNDAGSRVTSTGSLVDGSTITFSDPANELVDANSTPTSTPASSGTTRGASTRPSDGSPASSR